MNLLCRKQKSVIMHLKILKISLTVLFTHLKIILLQCFYFSDFNFQFQKK